MNTPISIRPATEDDIELILCMFDHSRGVMCADGNVSQWVGYPCREDVAEDIGRGVAYLVQDSSTQAPTGTFALVPGTEPTYHHIDHGRWIDTRTPYATLHRLAAMPGTSGIAECAFAYAKSRFPHLRVDTHTTNRPMRHILDKEGFVYCGIIYMPDGGPRDAYEWWRWDKVPGSLKQYIESEVLPRYDLFDPAHRRDHARRVMARAMMIEASPMTYVAAAMHDLGLAEGRERHHMASGRIIRTDARLKRWFSDSQIETIAQAAEDHRASALSAPRSLLGCIVAEADRDIEPETIVRRTVEFGLSHYPTLDREQHWLRTLGHLNEKYAEGGYIKLWLPDSPNAAPLADLRELIRDQERLRRLFDQLFTQKSEIKIKKTK